MGRLQVDGRRHAAFQGVSPTCDAKAPAVARLEPGKSPFGMRRNQVIAIEHGEIEKMTSHLNADGVHSRVFRAGSAETVAIESGQGIATTASQFTTENIGRHSSN